MKKPRKIYLDYNATTPVDPRVMEVMLPYFSDKFGNPSSGLHVYGWETEEAVNIAREQIAESIGARSNEIYFTSGATEAINLAIMGVTEKYKENGNHIITCTTEHKAVLDTCSHLEKQGFEISQLEVNKDGAINPEDLQNAICKKTIMVCLMHANNETGVIHPIKELAEIVKNRDVLFITDATQSIGKIPFDVENMGIDLVAFSSHKLYGPKGAGALYVRNRPKVNISPYLFGGGQERGLRPGTLNVPGIVGFGKAVELCIQDMHTDNHRLSKLRDTIEQELSILAGAQINGRNSIRLPLHLNLWPFPAAHPVRPQI